MLNETEQGILALLLSRIGLAGPPSIGRRAGEAHDAGDTGGTDPDVGESESPVSVYPSRRVIPAAYPSRGFRLRLVGEMGGGEASAGRGDGRAAGEGDARRRPWRGSCGARAWTRDRGISLAAVPWH